MPGAVLERNPYWPGPPLARLPAGAPPPALVVAAPALRGGGVRVACVVDGRAVIFAAERPDAAGSFACDINFLSYGGLHWVAAYSVVVAAPAGGPGPSLSLLGPPVLLVREPPAVVDGGSAAAVSLARAQLRRHEAALRAATPPQTAALGV